MSRTRAICFTLTAIGMVTMVLLGRPFSSITPKVDAQASSQLVPLVTDQTPMALSNSFGVPQSGVVNQAGDYAFIGNGASAVFYRPAGAAAPVRVMQMGDEVPGFPGSRNDITNVLRMNNSGLLAFRPDFFQANGVGQGIIFTFDGTTLQRIVAGNDPAPGGGGANFERSINLLGLNDAGDVAFTAPLVPSGAIGVPLQTTLYIVPAGGTPVRAVGLGDAAPGTGGTFSTLIPISFNNRGEELFSSTIVGGSGGQGLFIGSTTGVRKVIANGDTNPFGGTFLSVPTGLLNNAGQVAFQTSGALWIDTPATGISRVVNTGNGAPAPVGGTFNLNASNLQAFDDAGDIAFLTNVTGSAVSPALFRYRPSNPLEVVTHRTQAAAGAAGQTFSGSFTSISINATGVVSFRAALLGGPISTGVFQQTGASAPVNVALDGQATTLSGGGNYVLATSNSSTQTLNNGSVYFRSDISGGTADYAEFLISGGPPTILMNTSDALPTGAGVSLRTFRVSGAADQVGFLAQHTAGRSSIAVHNITSQATTVLTTDGDTAPGTGGGVIRLTTKNTVFQNAAGTVVFSAQIVGGSVSGTSGIFLVSSGSGLTKIVANGDVAPGTGGRTFLGSTPSGVTPSPINDAGQVVFSTTLVPVVPGPSLRAVFVWSPGTGASKVAAAGDGTSGGGTIVSFGGLATPWINSAGQVVFIANTGAGAGVQGIYVGTPGGTAAKVVAVGDSGPAGSTFAAFGAPGFNDFGEVAFMATLSGGPGGGVFVGSTSGPPVSLALDGAASPAGGNFSSTTARPEVLINNQHDVAFRGLLTGGTADSGYFMRRGPLGVLQAVVLQGQSAPGTTGGIFETILPNLNNFVSENFQLGPDGDLAFQSFFVASGQRTAGIFHVKTDNAVEEILVRGVVAPEFGGGSAIISTASTSWNSGGRYPVWARVSGGTFTDGIFLFVPTVSTNTPAGTAVPVTVTDSTTGTTPVAMTFDSVTVPGDTSLTTSSGGPALPTSFALGDPPVFYNLETTATFSGSIGVCIDFSSVSFPSGSTLRLLHYQGGVWVDVTTSGPTGSIICGSVTSLSPFTVVQLLNSPPVARARSITVSADGSCQASVTAAQVDDGSSDPDSSDTISISLDSTGPFSLGPHQVTLTVTDSYNATSSATATVTVVDTTEPVITLNGGNMTVELGSAFNDPGATASDNCAGSVPVVASSNVNVNSVGTYAVNYHAHDPANNQAAQVSRIVSVVDTTAPTLTVAMSPNSIWPPNNKLVQITASIQVSDISNSTTVQLVSIACNEALAADDIQGATFNTDDRSFQLRATRAGGGSGRVYTITYRARDASGNTTVKSAQVVVPHDQGH